jgi:MFS family permease
MSSPLAVSCSSADVPRTCGDGRRLFLAGLALFGVSSLLGGLSPSSWVLVLARALQGVGAAAFVPASLSLLTSIFARGRSVTAPSASTVAWRP